MASVAATVHADDLVRGMQALEMGNTAQTVELWRPLAESGNVEAQFGLGVIYNDAMGVEQDYAEANYWFLRAAEQGYAAAQYNLGNAYKHGTGMPSDPQLAVIWWRKAAEQDFPPAQFNLGSALIEGSGTPRDHSAGLAWYRRAAANGHQQAQTFLDEITAAPAVPSGPQPHRQAPETASAEPESVAPDDPAAATTAAPRVAAQPTDSAAAQTTATPAACADWLDRDTRTHTVQLLSSRQAADARQYAQRHGLDDTAICSYRVKGKRWHALLRGRYGSLDTARAALALLPAQVRSDGAYVRRIAEIRSAIGPR